MTEQRTQDRQTVLIEAAIAHHLNNARASQGRTLNGGERALYEQRMTAAYMQGITDSEIRAHAATQVEPWPEGTIARYLTVGGALVDVARSIDPADEKASRWDWTRATCTGCGVFDGQDWNTRPYDQLITVPQAEQRATRVVREWAQAHAERCRALPRPAVK